MHLVRKRVKAMIGALSWASLFMVVTRFKYKKRAVKNSPLYGIRDTSSYDFES